MGGLRRVGTPFIDGQIPRQPHGDRRLVHRDVFQPFRIAQQVRERRFSLEHEGRTIAVEPTDIAATASAGVNFNGPDGFYTAGLTAAAGAFAVNEVKRFFLVVKLSGTASTGETMQVSISAMVQNAPTGGALTGVPSGATSALLIDQPTLTVNAGPGNPTIVTREKSAAVSDWNVDTRT